MKATEIMIRVATKSDFDVAVEALNEGFRDDPVLTWVVNEPVERLRVMRDFFRLYMTLGLTKGVVHLASTDDLGLVGVSVWCPNGSFDEAAEKELERLGGIHAPRFLTLGDKLHAHYPPVAEYDQLMAISVLPSAIGLGIGGKLIAHRLHELDKLGIPTYLEATSRLAAGGVYQRFGYQPVGEPVKFTGGVEAYPMWRNVHESNSASYAYSVDDAVADNIMHFGGYNWRVVNVQDDKVLLISDKVIEAKMYHDKHENTAWVNCSIRKYLNGDFYNTFSEAEKSQILETRLPSYNNPWFGTDGGKYTNDNVFLLSIEEVVTYFGDGGQLRDKNQNTKYFINDDFNNNRKAVNIKGESSCWWLRSPGNSLSFASCVTTDGRIAVSGDFVNRGDGFNIGIRPAMYVDIQSFYKKTKQGKGEFYD